MNREAKIVNLLGKGFEIKWCDVCKGIYIKCPRCHNNTCSGGYGEDGNCPVCPIAYNITTKLELYFSAKEPECSE